VNQFYSLAVEMLMATDTMNHVFTILSAAALIYSARALPVRGVEPAWVAEPRGRGTIGLVLPCVITLALCVWTAIHLNVNSRPTRGRIFAFKLVWVLMGIFTPELVLWCSLSQYLEACAVRKEILEIRSQGNADKLPPTMWQKFLAFVTRRKATQASTVEDFNMKLAFFVIMGGYALDFAPENTKVSPKAITARYFVKLYGDGMIKDNDLDIKPIEDKAKADGLAKFVVCMQALVSTNTTPVMNDTLPLEYLSANSTSGLWYKESGACSMDYR